MFLQLQKSLPVLVAHASSLCVDTKEEQMTSFEEPGNPPEQISRLLGSISSMR